MSAAEQVEALMEPIRVHCFFVGLCAHIVAGFNPEDLHVAMERHYAEQHRADIASIVRADQ